MRKFLFLIISLFVLSLSFSFNNVTYSAYANESFYYLGGMPAGFSLSTKGAYVLGLTDVITENGIKCPAKSANIFPNDTILSIDGEEVSNSADIEKTLTNDKIKKLVIKRNNETFNYWITKYNRF